MKIKKPEVKRLFYTHLYILFLCCFNSVCAQSRLMSDYSSQLEVKGGGGFFSEVFTANLLYPSSANLSSSVLPYGNIAIAFSRKVRQTNLRWHLGFKFTHFQYLNDFGDFNFRDTMNAYYGDYLDFDNTKSSFIKSVVAYYGGVGGGMTYQHYFNRSNKKRWQVLGFGLNLYIHAPLSYRKVEKRIFKEDLKRNEAGLKNLLYQSGVTLSYLFYFTRQFGAGPVLEGGGTGLKMNGTFSFAWNLEAGFRGVFLL